VIKALYPAFFASGRNPEILLALPGQLGDVRDIVPEQHMAQRFDELHGGVFVNQETH
jgi:hypothetical protein